MLSGWAVENVHHKKLLFVSLECLLECYDVWENVVPQCAMKYRNTHFVALSFSAEDFWKNNEDSKDAASKGEDITM